MASGSNPRVVIITRQTEVEGLLEMHATMGQARFFLEQRKRSPEPAIARQEAQQSTLQKIEAIVPSSWRRVRIQRQDVDRFLFEPDDIVVAVGQDGLVANVAKYLHGNPVIGINPDPNRNPGILVPHRPARFEELLDLTIQRQATIEQRTMVEARLEDGQSLVAVNEVFIGHHSHQSARYELKWGEQSEKQSSSGVIVTTGTGSTGWAKSIHQERHSALDLPLPTAQRLCFFVREAWPSIATGASLTEGALEANQQLEIISGMENGGVIFGDGIESDYLEFSWGERAHIGVAKQRLHLVI
jgi:NAD kinase